MAGYFSNHSSSRFLANSSSATREQPPPSPSTQPPVSQQQRSRLPASKHFSTSVATTVVDERSQAKEKVANNSPTLNGSHALVVHPLRNTWLFWFRQQRAPGNKITNYEEGIKKIAAFSSVESFWSLWTHLNPPSALQATTDYLLFHSGVRRAVWEDPLNINGGKWIIRLKKGVADRIWENLVLAVIGDQFDECAELSEGSRGEESSGADGEGEWPEICGCTISVRQSEDIVSLWNKVDEDVKVREKIRDTLRRVLDLPSNTIMEYKSNNDSMQDKSSFRNSAIDRAPLS